MKTCYLFFSILIILLFPQVEAGEITDLGSKLEHANDIRSSKPKEFSLLLAEIQRAQDKLTAPQQALFTYLKAYQITFKGDLDKGITLFKQLVSVSNTPKEIAFRSEISLINIFSIRNQWTDGLSHLKHLLSMIETIKSIELRHNGYAVAAMFFNQLGQHEAAKRYADRLKTISTTERNNCLYKGLLIESLFKLNQIQPDDNIFNEGIASCQNEIIMAGFIRSYRLLLFIQNQQPETGIKYILPALSDIKSTKYPKLISEIESGLAQAYFDLNLHAEAETHAKKALSFATSLGNTQAIVTAYDVLFQISQHRGDYQLAFDYHVKYAQADKAFLDDIKTKHLAFQLAEHQAAEQKSRIALLDRQNNLLLTEQKLAKTQAENTRLFISLLIAIITLLGFWAYKSWTIQKRLKQLAEYDALTHVFNRGHFTQVAQSALAYCESTQADLSYILFDLDHFKQINDKYGHACGDWVLKKVAKVCQTQGRKNDIFARIGGEEFCIALPGCDLNTAIKLAEACRVAIANIDYSKSGHDFQVTASFGVTDTKLSSYKLERLFNDADSAMYQSKHGGRNRLYIFDPQAESVIPSTAEAPQSN